MISPWSVVKLHFINTASGYLSKLPSSHAARAFLRRPQEQICLFWSHPRWSDLSALTETMGRKQARLRGPRVTSSLSCLQAWPAHTNRKVPIFYGWQRKKQKDWEKSMWSCLLHGGRNRKLSICCFSNHHNMEEGFTGGLFAECCLPWSPHRVPSPRVHRLIRWGCPR